MTSVLLALPLLAGDSKIALPSPDDPLLLAGLATAVFWLLLLAAFAFATRSRGVEAGPATMELGPEPPAIVNLLVNGCRVTPNGVQSTLLDLAARNFIGIEEYGAGEQIVCRIKHDIPDVPLEPYTKIVFDHVRAEAVNGVVVAQALTTGTKGKADAWWKHFQGQILQDARSRGLTQDRWSRPMWGIQRLAGLAAGILLLVVAARANAIEPAIIVLILVAGSMHGVLARLFGEQQLSANGREAASRWLGVRRYLEDNGGFGAETPAAVEVWDRYLAYAAAMGLASKAIRSLPMGAEDDNRAWSAYGGEWRQVHVIYPHYRIIWGRSPLGALCTGLVISAIGCGIFWLALQVRDAVGTYSLSGGTVHWIRLGCIIALAVAVLILLWGIRTLGLAFLDLWTRIEVEGEVIRCRSFSADKSVIYFVALDDGKAARVRAWRVAQTIYHHCHEGSVIKAQVSPRLGYVHRIAALPSAGATST